MATTWTRIDESGTAIEWEQSGLEATENLSHSLLQDLTADDHPQYLTSTRGDALYEALGHGHTNIPITDLNNVNAPSPTNGQILVWVTANGQWEAQDQAAVISVSELNDLTDVQNLTPADKHVLVYDGVTDNRYENRLLVTADISDYSGISDIVEDTTPQLGGSLDTQSFGITTSTLNGNITLTPNGTGNVVLDGQTWPNAIGTNGYLLQTDGAGGLSWVDIPDDPTAIHTDEPNEISALTDKPSPVSADLVIIEDSENGFQKKKVTLGNFPTVDSDAIHDNVAGEINAIASKGSVASADKFLIEDSADSYNKKQVQISAILNAGYFVTNGVTTLDTPPTVTSDALRGAMAFGPEAEVNNSDRAIAMGHNATIGDLRDNSIVIGVNANIAGTTITTKGDHIVIGSGASISGSINGSVAIGKSVSNTIDESVRIGYTTTNVMHLKQNGRLSLEGTQAAYVLPAYTTGALPAAVEGALVWDTTLNQLSVYNGSGWDAIDPNPLVTEVNDLTASVTWTNVPDANITQSSVTQHESALTLSESQVEAALSVATAFTANNYVFNADQVVGVGTDGYVMTYNNGTGEIELTASATGNVSNTGTPLNDQVAVWTDATTVEGTTGLTYNGTALNVTGNVTLTGTVDGVDIAARDHDAVTFAGTGTYISLAGQVITVDPITESDITDLQAYLTSVAANDITDISNVTPADRHVLVYDGVTDNRYENRLLVEADISDLQSYVLNSEIDADIKTLSLPASTTISTFGASLIDDANQAAAQTTLGVDPAGTDNSTDVTLAGTGTYISIVGQVITVDPITRSDITDFAIIESDVETALASATAFTANNYVFNTDQVVGVGTDNYVMTFDNGTGEIGLEAIPAQTDADAVHLSTGNEFPALTQVTPANGDILLIEDASDSNNKKRITVGALPYSEYITANSTGTLPSATGTDAVAIGEGAVSAGVNAVALGPTATTGAGSTSGVALGWGATLNTVSGGGIAIGPNATVNALTAHAIGNSVTNATATSVRIGNSTTNVMHLKDSGRLTLEGTQAAFILPAYTSGAEPTAVEGALIWDTTNNVPSVYNGATWDDLVPGGNVSNTGTPLNDQIAVWTDATTVEGTTGLTYNGTALNITGNITLTGTVDGIDIAARDHDAVTFAGTGTYISLAGQVITVDPITESDITDLGAYITDVVSDTTPQLGGNLDVAGNAIVSVSNGDIDITPNGTGKTVITNIEAPLTINTQTGTTYGPVLADAEKMITLNNAAAITVTIPANSSVAYPVGTKLNFMQLGAGQVTVAITTDTLSVEAGLTLKLKGQYAVATAFKVSSTSWVLFGNLEAA